MTAVDDLPPTVLERYEIATQREIVVDLTHRTSADMLIGAGMAQASSLRNRAAFSLYRLHHKISAQDTEAIRVWCVTSLVPMWHRPPHKLRPRAAHEVFERVLHWYLLGVCNHCDGRRFELVPGVSQVTSTTPCHVCGGRGKAAVSTCLPKRYREPGEWLASEMERLVSLVESDMAARLRG